MTKELPILYIETRASGLGLKLLKAGKTIDKTYLTLSQDFDKLLIISLDKLLHRNRIEKLSLNQVSILGGFNKQAAVGRIVEALKKALEI